MNFTAEKGRYRARIELSFFERVVSNASIAQKLEAVGLEGVSVQGSGGTRWAFGTWNGETTNVELPSQIVQVDRLR